MINFNTKDQRRLIRTFWRNYERKGNWRELVREFDASKVQSEMQSLPRTAIAADALADKYNVNIHHNHWQLLPGLKDLNRRVIPPGYYEDVQSTGNSNTPYIRVSPICPVCRNALVEHDALCDLDPN